jgi:hypothetical protein
MMIDLILALFAAGMYLAGWKSHAKWGTWTNMVTQAKAYVGAWFK